MFTTKGMLVLMLVPLITAAACWLYIVVDL